MTYLLGKPRVLAAHILQPILFQEGEGKPQPTGYAFDITRRDRLSQERRRRAFALAQAASLEEARKTWRDCFVIFSGD
jgi:hypothetical protein